MKTNHLFKKIAQGSEFLIFGLVVLVSCKNNSIETPVLNDTNTPLHALQPDYKVPYGVVKAEDVKNILERVCNYLENCTPAELVNIHTQEPVNDFNKIDTATRLKRGDFRIVSYEWGVTYAGMLLASEVTGDKKFTEYTFKRLNFISEVVPYFRAVAEKEAEMRSPVHSVIEPRALDDAGAMCAAMIKAKKAGLDTDLQDIIGTYIDYIFNKQFRLNDGTLARNRPQPNTLWLDDLFMSVPALAQMGAYTGDKKYFDDAVKQVLQFSERMFNKDIGLFMHGWVQEMDVHPQFHWARANGWAIMAIVELLEVLPENYTNRDKIISILQAHIQGLAQYQSGDGFWHQLLDRNDSYLETSATAIYAYSIARAINRGFIDVKVYGPMVLLAWNAVSTKINERGQVEGTCVGTGMAFDPAFYYYRPTSAYAAHGYGPVLLAGSEIISLIQNHPTQMNDSSVQFED